MAETISSNQNGAMTPPTNADHALSAPESSTTVIPAARRDVPLWKIHELPVPIRTFPLPYFHPSNPLSLLHVAYAWIRQVLSPTREPAVIYEGVWSPSTRSVLITDPKSIRGLWEQGFYGKGHLSRSEPNWLKREQARKGAHSDHVAEVFTNQRREERIQMKWERARKEQEVIHRTRYEETRVAPVGPRELLAMPNSLRDLNVLIYGGAPLLNTAVNGDVGSSDHINSIEPVSMGDVAQPKQNGHAQRPVTPQDKSAVATEDSVIDPQPLKRRKSVRFSPKVESTTFQLFDPPSPSQPMLINSNGKIPDGILTNGSAESTRDSGSVLIQEPMSQGVPEDVESIEPQTSDELVDKEHLQLTLEEALWLSFGIGALQVRDEADGSILPVESLLKIGREYSYFPPRTVNLRPDDPFLIHYAVYHHFRSLGWVTRPGIKFGCDWLLYHRGPAFSHAEFAIIVLPSYSNPYWKAQGLDTTDRSWHWLHLVNRVQSTALKTLVLVYVDIPAPSTVELDMPSLFKQYKIREVMVKRWLINRNRD